VEEAKRKHPQDVSKPGTLIVASDIGVDRTYSVPGGVRTVDHVGKYGKPTSVYRDILHMLKVAHDLGVAPSYGIHSITGVEYDGQLTHSTKNIVVLLDQVRLNELADREGFLHYLKQMQLRLGPEGFTKISGGLELEYLLDHGYVSAIDEILVGDPRFDEVKKMAIHFAQVGIDPALLQPYVR
jgi:hypothetical protein